MPSKIPVMSPILPSRPDGITEVEQWSHLGDQRGAPLASPHEDVDFSEADQVNAQGTESERSVNAQRLRKAIERRGFQSLATE